MHRDRLACNKVLFEPVPKTNMFGSYTLVLVSVVTRSGPNHRTLSPLGTPSGATIDTEVNARPSLLPENWRNLPQGGKIDQQVLL